MRGRTNMAAGGGAEPEYVEITASMVTFERDTYLTAIFSLPKPVKTLLGISAAFNNPTAGDILLSYPNEPDFADGKPTPAVRTSESVSYGRSSAVVLSDNTITIPLYVTSAWTYTFRHGGCYYIPE